MAKFERSAKGKKKKRIAAGFAIAFSVILMLEGIFLAVIWGGRASEKKKNAPVVISFGKQNPGREIGSEAAAIALNQYVYARLLEEKMVRFDENGDYEEFKALVDETEAAWATADDYAAKLDFVTNLYLTGHSQGGLATILAGGMNPDRLKAIIPLSPAVIIKEGALKGDMLGAAFDPLHIPDTVEFPDGKLLDASYFRTAQLLPVEEAVKRYRGPVLIVHGDEDEAVPYRCAVELEKEYENAKLVTIPGDDHCYDYHLDQVLEAVTSFVKDCESGR